MPTWKQKMAILAETEAKFKAAPTTPPYEESDPELEAASLTLVDDTDEDMAQSSLPPWVVLDQQCWWLGIGKRLQNRKEATITDISPMRRIVTVAFPTAPHWPQRDIPFDWFTRNECPLRLRTPEEHSSQWGGHGAIFEYDSSGELRAEREEAKAREKAANLARLEKELPDFGDVEEAQARWAKIGRAHV